jgi:hypothetical protein
MSLKKYFHLFLNESFTGLPLKIPLFYNWPIGLRFELQTATVYGFEEEYFAQTVYRAVALFEEIFLPDDEIIIVCQFLQFKRERIRFGNYCFKQIGNLHRSEVAFKKLKNFYGNEQGNRAVFKVDVRRIDYKNILAAKANMDFPPRHPRLGLEIYFISLRSKVIFNMYDDRGVDIIASDKQSIANLYWKYNSWLLDYDRGAMDKVFRGR